MHNLKQLSNKERKILFRKIEALYGIKDLKMNYLFLRNNEGRIFIVNKKVRDVDLREVNVNSIGLYFARFDNELRLSMEGSQIMGPFANKNTTELNDEDARLWLEGSDIENVKENCDEIFVILKNKEDYIGTGKYKEGKILNYVPKERRIH